MTKSAGTACPATDITDLSPFVYETFCNSGACKLTFRPVVLKDVTVRMYPAGHYERAGYGGSGRQRDPLQGHSCYVDSGAGDGTEIKVYGFCYFLAEDSVCDILPGLCERDRGLYKAIVDATVKRRRTA